MKKATIKRVRMQVIGEWFVEYESGKTRTYKDEAKLPKTVKTWLASHPEVQKDIDDALQYGKELDELIALGAALKGKGRGCGKPYEEQLKKYGKHVIIGLADDAGMGIMSRTTKKEALAYLLGTEQMTSNENYAA